MIVTGKASVETILFEAIEVESVAERAAFVERACTGDAVMQHEVERLIVNHLRAGSSQPHGDTGRSQGHRYQKQPKLPRLPR